MTDKMIDPLEEDKIKAIDLLPIHWRIVLWICNNLVLYSLFLLIIGGTIGYYLPL